MHKADVDSAHRLSKLRCENMSKCAFSWEQVADSMVGCHQWCLLARDNWSCAGYNYTRVLNTTPCYNSSLSFDRWPAEMRVYAEGNSVLAQLLFTVLCNSHAKVWKISRSCNSVFAIAKSGASMFLLDNHEFWNLNTSRSMALLKNIGFDPTVIVYGDFNSRGELSKTERRDMFKNAFDRSRLVNFTPRKQKTCCADWKNCAPGVAGCVHGCFPGPINRDAEDLVRAILHLSVRCCVPYVTVPCEQFQDHLTKHVSPLRLAMSALWSRAAMCGPATILS